MSDRLNQMTLRINCRNGRTRAITSDVRFWIGAGVHTGIGRRLTARGLRTERPRRTG
jgi:hypothetical protein